MKKILKITLVVLSLVSVFFISSVSAFAYTQDELASYGSVRYTELTSTGVEVAELELPVIVNDDLPYYSRYASGANKTWQSLNYSGMYARIRNILPAKGMNGYVSKASNVVFTLDVAYPSVDFNNNFYNDYVFALDYEPYSWEPIHIGISSYIYDLDDEVLVNRDYFGSYSKTTADFADLGLSKDDIDPDIWFCFSIEVVFPSDEDASDFAFVLPDTYQYFPFNPEVKDAFDAGKDEGLDVGYDTGYDDGYDDGANDLSLGWLGNVIRSVTSIELIPGISVGTMIFFVFGLSIIGVIAKLMAGG